MVVKRDNGVECGVCGKRGATLGCFKPRCVNNYHLLCAKEHPNVIFFQDKVRVDGTIQAVHKVIKSGQDVIPNS